MYSVTINNYEDGMPLIIKNIDHEKNGQYWLECTKCHKVKPLFPDFGIRNMGNGELRSQAQCGKCR